MCLIPMEIILFNPERLSCLILKIILFVCLLGLEVEPDLNPSSRKSPGNKDSLPDKAAVKRPR